METPLPDKGMVSGFNQSSFDHFRKPDSGGRQAEQYGEWDGLPPGSSYNHKKNISRRPRAEQNCGLQVHLRAVSLPPVRTYEEIIDAPAQLDLKILPVFPEFQFRSYYRYVCFLWNVAHFAGLLINHGNLSRVNHLVPYKEPFDRGAIGLHSDSPIKLFLIPLRESRKVARIVANWRYLIDTRVAGRHLFSIVWTGFIAAPLCPMEH